MKRKKYIYITFIPILLFMMGMFSPVSAYGSCGVLDSKIDSVVNATTLPAEFESWGDTGAEVTVDLNGYTGDVFVIASIQSASDANATIGSWQLTDGSTSSTPISRYLSSGSDYGQATASHIFSGLSGNPTFRLQHQTGTANREVVTTANLVAIPLVSSDGDALNHDSVSTEDIDSTDSAVYQGVPNTTASLKMPMDGNVYLVASFNSTSDTVNGKGLWTMQSRLNDGTLAAEDGWGNVGWPTARVHSRSDIGAVSLTALAEGLSTNTGTDVYEFRLAVKSNAGAEIVTTNVTLSAIALTTGSGFFSSFTDRSESVSIDNSQVDQKQTAVSISRSIDVDSGGTKVFMGSHYELGGGPALMWIDTAVDSSPLYASQEISRALSNPNDAGNGGAIGLSDTLAAGATHEMALRFAADSSGATITNPVLVVIGMSCRTGDPLAVSLADIAGTTTAVSPIIYALIVTVLMLFTLVFLHMKKSGSSKEA